jgi:hypothetical protein
MMDKDAEYYQAHKDDTEEWGEADRRKPERRRLAAMISVRFLPEEEAVVRKEAATRKTSVSNFVRMAALRECAWPRRTHFGPLLVNRTAIGEWSAEAAQTGVVFEVPGFPSGSQETLVITAGE